MTENICNNCGCNYIYKDGKWVCPGCGAYKPEEMSNEENTLLYNAATKLRLANFDEAEDQYRDIIQKYPKNSEAHWGLVLAKYGIKYEDDYDGKKLPTCYATSIESVLTDTDYLAAIDLCSDYSRREYYIEQGKFIEKIRIEWIEKASKEPKYDIFLCFKDSDKINNFERTDDSVEVANLYSYLTELGYRVFYSRVSLRDKSGEKYEPYIYNALNTASIMIVYGSKAEYFTSTWMKNEWTRFYKRIRDGLKVEGSLLAACDGVNPSDLPNPLGNLQCIDAKAKTFYGDLEKYIKKILAISDKPKATVERIEISKAIGKKRASINNEIKTIKIDGNVAKKNTVVLENAIATRELGTYDIPYVSPDENIKIKNIYRSIEKGLFDNAQGLVNEVLPKNKLNGSVLLASLLIKYKSKNIDELAGNISEIEDFELIHSVIDYNEKEKGEKIVSIVCDLVRKFVDENNYTDAIKYFKEISEYNTDIVRKLKDEVIELIGRVIYENAEVADDFFEIILDTYQDENTYIDFIQNFISKCILAEQYEIAKKYNDKIIIIDESNFTSVFNEIFIEVHAKDLKDFARLSDGFGNYDYLDISIKKFDKNEIKDCFAKFEEIFNYMIECQVSGETICKWFAFVSKYEYNGRDEFIQNAINKLSSVNNIVTKSSLFDKIVKCIDGSDIEKHISMRIEFAKKLQLSGEFSLAINYYKQVLEIEEGNITALWNIILCLTESKRENDISEKIDRFTSFGEIENLLRYCPSTKERVEYLNKIINAITFKSGVVNNKDLLIKLSKVFESVIKYYPEEYNNELIQHLIKFADNCKKNSIFELSEKYYATILTIDKMQHIAYWGLLQSNLKCRNNDDLIKNPKIITDTTEFRSAVSAVGDDDRSADKYWTVAKQQNDYLEKEKEKEIHRKKQKRKIKITMTIVSVITVLCLTGIWVYNYFKIETNLKFNNIGANYEVLSGSYYKETKVIIPDTYNGEKVTKIAENAFAGNTRIASVTIPSTVTEIGAGAFSGCTNLREIILSDLTFAQNINYVGNNYQSEIMPLSVYTISDNKVFVTTNPVNNSKSNIKVVGDNAFNGCISLRQIDLTNVERIGNQSFAGCSSLNTVNIGNNLKTLSEKSFSGCSLLENIGLSDGLLSIGNNCFENCNSLLNISIPSSVQSIGESVFTGCEKLTNLIIEERDEINGFNDQWKQGIPDKANVKIGFKVTLNYNNATNTGNNSITATQGLTCELPVPSRNGYKFLGWFDSLIDGQRITDEDGVIGTYNYNKSITLYAVWEANINTIVFEANGGQGNMNEQKIATDSSDTLLSCNFNKNGYHFIGWGTTTNSVTYSENAQYTMGANSVYHLYAIWEANTNTLIFDGNGYTSGTTENMQIKSDSTVNLNQNGFTRYGFTFAGWSTSKNGIVEYLNKSLYTMGTDESYILYAIWNEIYYDITYSLNGGDEVNNLSNYSILTDTFTLTNPTKAGYTFTGWTGTDLLNNSFEVTISKGTTGNKQYTANWQANENELIFDSNSGSGEMSTITVNTDEIINLPENVFTKTGYTFIGWSTTDNGIVIYENKVQYKMGVNSSYTLYAVWEIVNYSITYNYNGGFGSNIEEYTINNNFSLVAPSKDGYDFIGWTGTDLQSATKNVTILKGSIGDRSYTANWKPHTYTLTFDANSGECDITELNVDYNTQFNLPFATRKGYDFLGWFDTLSDTEVTNGTWRYLSDLDLYAKWDIITYNIHYVLGGGTNNTNNPNSYNVDIDDITILNPSKAGYTFTGWNSILGNNQFSPVIAKNSINDITFTATYTPNLNTIVFKGNTNTSGSMESIQGYTDSTIYLPENLFIKTGYHFTGWSNSANGQVLYNDKSSFTVPTNVITNLYAIWEENVNSITFFGNGNTSGTMTKQHISTNQTDNLKSNEFEKTGYHFAGWSTSSDGEVEYTDNSSYTMGTDANYNLFAIWQANTYTIYYDVNGGTLSQTQKDVTFDSNYTLDIPAKAGYNFDGWYLGEEQLTNSDGSSLNIYSTDGDITAKAQWSARTNVLLLKNGTEQNMTTGLTNTWVRIPANTFEKEGYEFSGWATSVNGEIEYYNTDLFYIGTDSSYTLYSIFTIEQSTTDRTDWIAISTPEDLKNIANNLSGKYYLTNDIDMYGVEWTPIGMYHSDNSSGTIYDNGFTGIFDGNNFTIYNLTSKLHNIYITSNNSGRHIFYTGAGLFGYNNGEISNLKVVGADINYTLQQMSTYSLQVVKFVYVYTGIITSYNNGIIENCLVQGNIQIHSEMEITASGDYYYGSVYLKEINIGGIAGYEGTITNCEAYVNITSNYEATLGEQYPNIENVKTFTSDKYNNLFNKGYIWLKHSNGTYRYIDAKWHSLIETPLNIETKQGYTFAGWSKTNGGNVDYALGEQCYIPVEQEYLILYPVWSPNDCIVAFNANGGSGTMDNQIVKVDKTTLIKECDFQKIGYHIGGWTANNNSFITSSDSKYYINCGINESVTLSVIWQPNNNTIVFNANGGTGLMDNQSIKTDETLALNKCTFIAPTGYYFAGWSTSQTGAVEYTDCDNYTCGTAPTYNLYAIWSPLTNTIIFNENGGSGTMSNQSIKTDETLALNKCTYEAPAGYYFAGWSTSPTGTVEYSDCDNYTSGTAPTYNLYAIWNPNINSIVFNANGGTGTMDNQSIKTDETLLLNECLFVAPAGYYFAGWSTSSTGAVEYTDCDNYTSGTTPIYNLYAIWQRIAVFNEYNGTITAVTDYGKTLTEIDIAECTDSTVTSISSTAFNNCTNLTNVIVPNTVTSIVEGAFSGCSSLTKITLPFVGDKAHISSDKYQYPFGYIFGTNSYTGGIATTQYYYGSSTSSTTNTTYYIPTSLKEVVITGSTYITYGAFYNCNVLTHISIPESVTSMESNIFTGCSSLEELTIPFTGASLDADGYTNQVLGYFFGYEKFYIDNKTLFSATSSKNGYRFADGLTDDGYTGNGIYQIRAWIYEGNKDAGGTYYFKTLYHYYYFIPRTLKTVNLTVQTEYTSEFRNCTLTVNLPSNSNG